MEIFGSAYRGRASNGYVLFHMTPWPLYHILTPKPGSARGRRVGRGLPSSPCSISRRLALRQSSLQNPRSPPVPAQAAQQDHAEVSADLMEAAYHCKLQQLGHDGWAGARVSPAQALSGRPPARVPTVSRAGTAQKPPHRCPGETPAPSAKARREYRRQPEPKALLVEATDSETAWCIRTCETPVHNFELRSPGQLLIRCSQQERAVPSYQAASL